MPQSGEEVETRGVLITAGGGFNASYNATQRLNISNDWVTFDARFGGIIHHVRFPVRAVLGIYARETGEGMAFSGDDPTPPPDKTGPGAGDEAARRPQLKIVK